MANTTITKLPDAWADYNGGSWYPWVESTAAISQLVGVQSPRSMQGYMTRAEIETALFSAATITVNIENSESLGGTLRCKIFNQDPREFGTYSPIASQSYSVTALGQHEFRISGLNAVGPAIYFVFDGGDTDRTFIRFRCLNSSITYSLPALGVGVTPSSLYANEQITLSFQNRLSEALTVQFSTNATPLQTITAESDQITFTCPESWFDTAGVTADSTSVTVSVSDVNARTGTARFTLKRPVGSKASPIAPRSARLEGSNPINFSWSVDESDGAQTEAWLEWSTDNAVWESLAHIESGDKTWTAPRVEFPAGTIYWHVKVKNTFGIVGIWSQSASFTVQYAATAQVVPVDSPTSGVINAQIDRAFSVMLETSGATYEPFTIESGTFYWRSHSSGPFTALTMATNADRASVLIEAGTFPSGTLQWYAEATDNTGRTTLTDTFTLSTLSAEVEAIPVSPIDTVESGSSVIVFRWEYGSIDGSPQKNVELQISSDGETWDALATVTGSSARSYSAAASTFDAGLTYWRARATSQNNVTGPWSAVVSFISFAAPVVVGVAADSMPFATVTWQVNGQLAFEIDIDGEIYGDYGANVRSYTWPEPLQPGAHSVKVRAQNQYGLWSEWTAASFYTNTPQQSITLAGEADESVHLTWNGGEASMPVITVQPSDMWATEGLMSFSVDAVGSGLSFQWFMQPDASAPWNALHLPQPNGRVFTASAAAESDGRRFKCRVISAAGSVESDVATFHYAAPAAAPVIEIQPKDVLQTEGTVYIYCGADGSSYEWFHRSAESLSPGLQVVDQDGHLWHIPYGDVPPGAQRVTDGADDNWYLPLAGQNGALPVTDGTGTWYILPGPGSSSPEWEAMGIHLPYITFPADELRSGEQFFCRVTNEAGHTDSRVAVYMFDDPPIEEGGAGDYYVYRDGELLDRTTEAHYEDRTALGEHTYVIFNRLINNNAAKSNAVTLTVAVRCLTIGLLSGGPWQTLRWSDRENRELTLTRSREVRWTHYAGAKYPEADVGEAEDLVGSFDAAWLANNREQADAFEDLLGEEVVVKTPRGVVVVGVLAGFDRRDPRFYKSYSFEVRQEDWGGRVDA